MAYQTPLTVRQVLDRIHARDYVLPAIQREFVWGPDQICQLFDSLMLKYPIGAFLFWQVDEDRAREFVFYEFMSKYHERLHRRCERMEFPQPRRIIAILDGQQRLTSLNIGLNGTYAEKLPRKRAANPEAYPEKRLYLELCRMASDDERGLQYRFGFLTTVEAANRNTEEEHWFLVANARDLTRDAPTLLEYVKSAGIASSNEIQATRTLDALLRVVHEDLVIAYHLEEDQDLDRVLNIFIRVNRGGTQLSYSDLLLSIATAEWPDRDAREAVNGLVDEMNSEHQGFAFNKDLVLKAGLVLTEVGDIRFKVSNFTQANMAKLDKRWDENASALRLGARLLGQFGFSERTLTAHNVLIPVAYYMYCRNLGDAYLTHHDYAEDRSRLRSWVTRSLLVRGIWSSGVDTFLAALREVIREQGQEGFPVEQIETEMAVRGKSLRIDPEVVEDLADTPYSDRRVFPLLALLYPNIDVRYDFHIDHIFPQKLTTRKEIRELGKHQGWNDEKSDAIVDAANRLANLQLLEGIANEAKQTMLPLDWVQQAYPDEASRLNYVERHDLLGLPSEREGFWDFYVARRGAIQERLVKLLGVSAGAEETEAVETPR